MVFYLCSAPQGIRNVEMFLKRSLYGVPQGTPDSRWVAVSRTPPGSKKEPVSAARSQTHRKLRGISPVYLDGFSTFIGLFRDFDLSQGPKSGPKGPKGFSSAIPCFYLINIKTIFSPSLSNPGTIHQFVGLIGLFGHPFAVELAAAYGHLLEIDNLKSHLDNGTMLMPRIDHFSACHPLGNCGRFAHQG